MLDSYERHYPFLGAVAGAFDFVVNGDAPNGAEVVYDSAGVRKPFLIPRSIVLYALHAEFKEIVSGNQVTGLNTALYVCTGNNGAQVFLKSGITTPLGTMLSWHGELPNDWGFGVSVPTAGGLGVTHKMVLTAQYRMRRD